MALHRWDNSGWDTGNANWESENPWGSYTGGGSHSSWGGGNDSWSGGRRGAGRQGGQGGRRDTWSSGGGDNAWDNWKAGAWGGGRQGGGGGRDGGGWASSSGRENGKPASDPWESWDANGTWQGGAAGSGSSGAAANVNGDNGWGAWGDCSDPSSWAPSIRTIDWKGMQLLKIEKNFHEEHPAVKNRSDAEVEEIRRLHDIEVLAGVDDQALPKPVTTFVEAGLPEWLLAGVRDKGFKAPTPIQIQVWPIALQGRDLIGIAETGSGKTLAYLLPMMIHIMAQEELKANEGPVGVVLCPTRELALQINEVSSQFVGESGLNCQCIYGGVDVKRQGWALKEKTDIVVATPGRFIQLLNDGWTNLNRVTYVVLDEADVMLKQGFGDQIRLILSQVRPDRQMLMFSATWPKEVQKMAMEHCTQSEGLEPVTIRVGGDRLAACRTITQQVIVLASPQDKFEKLKEAVERSGCGKRGAENKCLIFCRTKAAVDELVWKLIEEGQHIEAKAIHSDKQQWEREEVLRDFKKGELSCLVSTDCLGRGHDIPRVKYVINYDAPDDIESYIHRIGRTGRAGEEGFAITFLTQKEAKLAAPLVKVLNETSQSVPDNLKELEKEQERETGWEWNQQQNHAEWPEQSAVGAGQSEEQGWAASPDGGWGSWQHDRGGAERPDQGVAEQPEAAAQPEAAWPDAAQPQAAAAQPDPARPQAGAEPQAEEPQAEPPAGDGEGSAGAEVLLQ